MNETRISIVNEEVEQYLIPAAHFFRDIFEVIFNYSNDNPNPNTVGFISFLDKESVLHIDELLPENLDDIVSEQMAGLSSVWKYSYVVTNSDEPKEPEIIRYHGLGRERSLTILYVAHDTFRKYLEELSAIMKMEHSYRRGTPVSELQQFIVIRYLLQLREEGILPK